LVSSIANLNASDRNSLSAFQHRNSIQQYVFLLTWLCASAEQCALLEAGKEPSKVTAGL
jgi:hypothetical protein